jgi:spore coat protein U-like protein
MSIARPTLIRMLAVIALAALWSEHAAAAASCTLSATGPAFGVYDPFSATARTANGTVQATCTYTGGPGVTNINLVARYNTGFSGNFANREMRSGTRALNYNIYFDAAFTLIRGDGTGGTQAGNARLSVSAGNRTDSVSGTIYGRIPAGQDAWPGVYADTITITVTY